MKYGPEITAEIAGHISSGLNRTDSTILAGISYETFTVWMRDHSDFSEAVRRAEVCFKQTHLNRISKAGEIHWLASAWILERKFPEEFALKNREQADPREKEIPQRMAERAHDLLSKLETRKPMAAGVNGNGNGKLHP